MPSVRAKKPTGSVFMAKRSRTLVPTSSEPAKPQGRLGNSNPTFSPDQKSAPSPFRLPLSSVLLKSRKAFSSSCSPSRTCLPSA
jgi:hypothetical protein